jgi:signal transduction protein with GAF and PtsI domain
LFDSALTKNLRNIKDLRMQVTDIESENNQARVQHQNNTRLVAACEHLTQWNLLGPKEMAQLKDCCFDADVDVKRVMGNLDLVHRSLRSCQERFGGKLWEQPRFVLDLYQDLIDRKDRVLLRLVQTIRSEIERCDDLAGSKPLKGFLADRK